jgi:hypothetical protein
VRDFVFIIDQVGKNKFIARTLDESIFTEAENFDSLKYNIIEAVQTHLDVDQSPINIRFQFRQVSTLSIIGYLAAIYAWLGEACVVLLHLLGSVKPNAIGHIALLLITISLSAFAWYRREDFRTLRASKGHIPLSGFQLLVVVAFLMGLVIAFVVVSSLLFGL